MPAPRRNQARVDVPRCPAVYFAWHLLTTIRTARGGSTHDSAIRTATGKTLTLRDGRTLGYAEYGDPRGTPVFLCHGTPGSRLDRHPDETIATSLGVRLIVPDRPGYGLSSFQTGRSLLDWPADLDQLADSLGIGRFAVVGVSGGDPTPPPVHTSCRGD